MIEPTTHRIARQAAGDAGERAHDHILAAVVEISDAEDLPDMLARIASHACSLIPAAGSLVLLRTPEGLYDVKAGGGDRRAAERAVACLPGEVREGLVAALTDARGPVVLGPYEASGKPGALVPADLTQVLAVPLGIRDDLLGVVVLSSPAGASFASAHLERGRLFASLTSRVLAHAQLHAQLKSRASTIAHQTNLLERQADFQRTLTRSLRSAENVETVVDLLADVLRKPVMLYSPDFQLTSWSAPASLGLSDAPRLPIDALRSSPLADAIEGLTDEAPATIIPPSKGARLAVRHLLCQLAVDEHVVGYFDVMELGTAITMLDIALVEHAAGVLSFEMRYRLQLAFAARTLRSRLLSELISPERSDTECAQLAEACGVDLTKPHVLVAVAYHDDDAVAAARRSRMADAIDVWAGATCIAAESSDGIDVFMVGPLSGDALASGDTALDVTAVVHELHGELQIDGIAVSGPCETVSDYPIAFRALVHGSGNRRSTVSSSTVRVKRPRAGMLRFFNTDEQLHEAICVARQLLRPLHDHEALLSSMETFIRHNGNIRASARELAVHENTIRYRIERIRRISGLDLQELGDLGTAGLALELVRLGSAEEGERHDQE